MFTNIISNRMANFSDTLIGFGVKTARVMETVHSQH